MVFRVKLPLKKGFDQTVHIQVRRLLALQADLATQFRECADRWHLRPIGGSNCYDKRQYFETVVTNDLLMMLVFLGAFCFLKASCQSTTVIYDGRGNVIGGSFIKIPQWKPVSLKDSVTGIIYSLDSAHIIVAAQDTTGKLLWKTDPWKDNKISVYRIKRPVIVDFKIVTTDRYYPTVSTGTRVLWIVYINTQFGLLNLANGSFLLLGQD